MTDTKSDIVFNISGGNNQILPNATHAEQHFYGNQPMEQEHETVHRTGPPDASSRLTIYISDVEKRKQYEKSLSECHSANEVGKIVVSMVQEVPGLTSKQVSTKAFITILLDLATSVTKGNTVPNFRRAITSADSSKRD